MTTTLCVIFYFVGLLVGAAIMRHTMRAYHPYDQLAEEHAKWSQATFGSDGVRGPQGAIKHLATEIDELWNAPYDKMEQADVLLLLLDASRRSGTTARELVQAGLDKMEINRARKWKKPAPGEPAFHVKGE